MYRLVLLSVLQLLLSQLVAATNPTVTISSGVVIGTTTTLPSETVVVHKYLGMPFAVSPPQRFSPPEPPAPWSTLTATSFKDACVQQFNYPEPSRNFSLYLNELPPPAPTESEDCLYLNVFTPATATPDSKLAVMFWIYGGNLQSGTSTYPFYDGSSFATNQNVIFVTHNYRTNVLGFPSSPELAPTAQNLGFLDQRLALSWVQENIHSFGGCPDKVTIFGESAGGYSVKQLLATPPHPLPFHAAILESETVLFASANGSASWAALVAAVNCTTAVSPLDCVRGVEVSTIQNIIEVNALAFPPVVDNVTNSGNVSRDITSHALARVPILIGTNAQEGRLFAYAASLDGPLNLTTFLNATFPGQAGQQAAIAAAYPPSLYPSAYDAIAAILTDLIFTCPIAALADLAHREGYAVWRYYFNASFPNTQLFPDAGVFHSSEIPLVFGTYEVLLPRVASTPREVRLSRFMQTTWADFAKAPHRGPGWERVPRVGVLGAGEGDGEVTIGQEVVDGKCGVYAVDVDGSGL